MIANYPTMHLDSASSGCFMATEQLALTYTAGGGAVRSLFIYLLYVRDVRRRSEKQGPKEPFVKVSEIVESPSSLHVAAFPWRSAIFRA